MGEHGETLSRNNKASATGWGLDRQYGVDCDPLLRVPSEKYGAASGASAQWKRRHANFRGLFDTYCAPTTVSYEINLEQLFYGACAPRINIGVALGMCVHHERTA